MALRTAQGASFVILKFSYFEILLYNGIRIIFGFSILMLKEIIMDVGREFSLEEDYSPLVLAGIFGEAPSGIYRLIKLGRIPPTCSYRDALRAYVNYWKLRGKAGENAISEIVMARRAELDRVRIEQGWFNIRKERGLLISKEEFVEVFSPIYLQIRDQLRALIKRHPDLRQEIDGILESWADIGKQYKIEVKESLDNYVEDQLNELKTLEEKAKTEEVETTKRTLEVLNESE